LADRNSLREKLMPVQTEDGMKQTTKLDGIGKRATYRKDMVFKNIGHVVDLELLRASYRQLEGKKAVCIDGVQNDIDVCNLLKAYYREPYAGNPHVRF
jgi:hypothetical protein